MRIILLFNEISATPTIDEQDVLSQCDAIENALRELKHDTVRLPCNLNLQLTRQALLQLQPDVVFNLVESLEGTDRLLPVIPLLLESMGIAFTGSSSHAILTTSGKIIAKQWMHQAGLPTPAWLTVTSGVWNGKRPARVILKAVWEHASFGMDDSAVVDCRQLSDEQLITLLETRQSSTGKMWFAEQFVDGREFNLTLLAGSAGPEVMPPAEIQFVDFPPEKPRIVGYAAKWHAESPEYSNTPRTFAFPEDDTLLLESLKQLATDCWNRCGMEGYARVDFRVDSAGTPWVLEINANPCLSPDAGFVAAAEMAGLNYTRIIDRIVRDALNH